MLDVREAWTDERLDDLNEKVDRGFEKVDARFDKVDARFDKIDRRFAQAELGQAGLAARTTNIEGLLISMNQRFDQVEARFDRLLHTLLGGLCVIVAALLGIIATQI